MSTRDILRMILVLTIVTSVCGGALSLVKIATEPQIEYQRIKNIKAPALKKVLTFSYDNDPVKDRMTMIIGKDKKGKPIKQTFFFAKKGGKIVAIALESHGKGFKDQVGVMMSILVDKDQLGGIAVTTHSETPGVGTLPINSPEFLSQFKGKSVDLDFSPQGGTINAYSGATYTSHGIEIAVNKGVKLYKKLKTELLKQHS